MVASNELVGDDTLPPGGPQEDQSEEEAPNHEPTQREKDTGSDRAAATAGGFGEGYVRGSGGKAGRRRYWAKGKGRI